MLLVSTATLVCEVRTQELDSGGGLSYSETVQRSARIRQLELIVVLQEQASKYIGKLGENSLPSPTETSPKI